MDATTTTTSKPETKAFPIPHWHVGKNIPGYLPEGDVLVFEDWEDARSYLQDELDPDDLTDDWDGDESEQWEALAKEWDDAKEDVGKLEPGDEFLAYLPLSLSEWDLGIAAWLNVCNEVCEDEDE